jgi:hypothetical protein
MQHPLLAEAKILEKVTTGIIFNYAYINSEKLRQAWNERLQAVLGGDTFWAALEIKTPKLL